MEGLDILSRNLSGQAPEAGYGGMREAAQTLTVVIPLQKKLRGGRKTIVTNGVMALEAQQEITLIKAVARAFRWRGMLESGAFATINELVAAEKIDPSYVSRVLRLTLLAPGKVEAILDGRQPEGVTVGWGEQAF